MIDLRNLEKYRENNRIEAKKALGGLPHSLWETYSAFANTLGGLILLGVVENKDKSLCAIDLPDPEKLIREFFELVNDPKKASVNILSDKDVTVENVDSKRIVVIRVPRADRACKPVYVEGDPQNSYRRNGEGDYKCTAEELEAMYRDASAQTQDMLVLEKSGLEVFNSETLASYRQRMREARPGHVWNSLRDEEFLLKIGAAGIGEDSKPHPTRAGLLTFGNEYDVKNEFPHFSLVFREEQNPQSRTDGVFSSGNVYGFYFGVCGRLQSDPEVRCDASVAGALKEALTNCLVNADYCGRGGVEIVRKRGGITLTNPGSFRIGIDEAKSGGFSDPRNGAMQKIFNLIDIGERTGSGIPNIFRVWREKKWAEPAFSQSFEPDRITLSLPFEKSGDKKDTLKPGGKRIFELQKETVIEFLTDKAAAKTKEVADSLGVSPQRARAILSKLIAEGFVIADGKGRARTYRMKW
ncbi:MAG: putative DNA binding domain-containing protein [Clostridia bacterium]|nr:putative DNA binding domain-containing protein [Clostridia bacterium]